MLKRKTFLRGHTFPVFGQRPISSLVHIKKSHSGLELFCNRERLTLGSFGEWFLKCSAVVSTRDIQTSQRDSIGKLRHPGMVCQIRRSMIEINF